MRAVAIAPLLAALMLGCGTASAQVGPILDSPIPPCTETQPAAVVAAWGQAVLPGQSGHDAAEAAAHPLTVGKPNKIDLVAGASAHFPVPPGGEAQPKEYVYVGIAGFTIPKDGTYRVVTDEGMRIDVVAGGKLVDSTAFGRGPHCSGKFVDFPLRAGPAVLQLYGAPYATVTVLVLPSP